MAIWRAKCWLGSSAGYQDLEVKANTLNGAKDQLERIYGAEQIINLREVRSSSGSSSDSDGSGIVALVALGAAAWAFFTFTPWILMTVGGALGTWIGEKMSGQTLEEYSDRKDDYGHSKAAFAFALALILGGIGFVQGTEIKKGFDAPDTPKQQIKK
jgi:hypothetical protein